MPVELPHGPGPPPLQLLDGRPTGEAGWLDPLSVLGCYTSLVVDAAGAVVALADHLRRLRDDSALLLGEGVDARVVRQAARHHLAQARGGAEAFDEPVRLRIAVLARTAPLRPEAVESLHVATASRPVPPAPDRPWRVQGVPYVRALPQVKSLDPFWQLHHKRSARLAGYDDAVLTSGGRLLEGSSWGLVAVVGDVALAPQEDVLPSLGVSRLLVAARAAGLGVERRALHQRELAGTRLLLACNAVTPVQPVDRVDDTPVAVDVELLEALRAGCAAAPAERLG